MVPLTQKRCVPCQGGTPPLDRAAIAPLHAMVPMWEVVGGKRLLRSFAFQDFKTALQLVDRIGALAEEEGHHPDLQLGYGKVQVEIWTHKIDGLTESDFILAAKVDQLVESAPGLDLPGTRR
jgi:4a-hydroxytetrahydrobiopterin dehydratase